MDAEMREAFKEVRSDIRRTEDKVDAFNSAIGKVNTDCKLATQRLDDHVEEHKERRKWRWALAATVIATAIAQLWNWVTGRKP